MMGLLDFRESFIGRGGCWGCCCWSWRGGYTGGWFWLALGFGVIVEGLFVLGFKDLRDLGSTSAGFLCPRTVDDRGGAFCALCFEGDILVKAKEKEEG